MARRILEIVAVFSLAALLATGAGCSSESPEALLAAAKQDLEKKNYPVAIIKAKNSLQAKPDQGEARYVLGKALFEQGDIRAAEVELRKALELRFTLDLVMPLLVRSSLALRQYDKVIEVAGKASVLTPAARAEIRTAVAFAHAGKNDLAKAKTEVEAALADRPDYDEALILQGRIKAAGGDSAGALANLEKVLSADARNISALTAKAEILLGDGKTADAIVTYRKAVEAKPDLLLPRAALVKVLLQQAKTDDAKAQIAEMKRIAANSPLTLFADGLYLFTVRDYKSAREVSTQLLKAGGDYPPYLHLAGAIEYSLKSYLQAESYLARAVSLASESIGARRWLAQTYMASGNPAKAVAVLEPVLDRIGEDAVMLSLAGDIYLQRGDARKAELYLSRALKLDPKDAGKRTAMAMARLAKGEDEAALADMAKIASDDAGTVADRALIATYLQRRDYDNALKALTVMQKKGPDSPFILGVRGQIEVAKGDQAAARKSFEKVLALNPAYYTAAAALAALDVAANKPEEARQRFESVLAADPKSVYAVLALAELRIRAKAPMEEVLGFLNRAISLEAADPAPRLALVNYYLGVRQAKKAVEAGQQALSTIPDDANILEALGRAQFAAGENNQALATFGKVAAAQPRLVGPHLRMAEVHRANKDTEAAAASLQKALNINPGSTEAQMFLMSIAMEKGKPEEARAIARAIQKQRPGEALGYQLEGDIDFARKAYGPAADVLRAGLKLVPASIDLASKLYVVLGQDGKQGEADAFADKWMRDRPQDSAFRMRLGEMALLRGDHAGAVRHYKAYVEQRPENVDALNNLAWAAGQMKDPKALEYAEKAFKMAPDNPSVMDTLGSLLLDKGDNARALELLGKATRALPQLPTVRLNYARALLKAGNKADAKKELEELVKLGDKYKRQTEVAQLLREI